MCAGRVRSGRAFTIVCRDIQGLGAGFILSLFLSSLTKEEKNNLLIHLLPIQEKETGEYLSVERTVSRRPFRGLLDVGILIGGCFKEKELIGDIHRKTNLVDMFLHT
ncbi:hypothetical protein MKW98_011648 [Papaver atlanticum]|uniref:Uncharacterized protein n=1 Tax=Papaver atlanticum TaxID=357466 RepID=A0AAD4S871_9MAGN|nr:hypothetical protein MKW98_011648 [Papaver atlanticum]